MKVLDRINLVIFSVIILFLLWFFQVQFFAIFYQRYQMNIIRESAIEIKNTIEEDLLFFIHKQL